MAEDDEEYCEHCADGNIEVMWNTVWSTGLSGLGLQEKDQMAVLDETPCVLVLNELDATWYLTLGGCGMDLTAGLCAAWLLCGFEWLPMDWVESLASSGYDYCKYVAGKHAEKVWRVAGETATAAAGRAQGLAEKFEKELEEVK